MLTLVLFGVVTTIVVTKIAVMFLEDKAEQERLKWISSDEYRRWKFRERGEDYDEYLDELRLKRERDAKFKYLSGY
jgi:hypothetical protein